MRKGFTLIELMIVITIIAILATIAIVSFSRIQKQARDTKRKEDIRAMITALQAYNNEKASFPVQSTPAAASSALSLLAPTYISGVPTGPVGTTGTNADYMYVTDTTGSQFGICVQLEAPNTSGSMWYVTTSNAAGVETPNVTCTPQ